VKLAKFLKKFHLKLLTAMSAIASSAERNISCINWSCEFIFSLCRQLSNTSQQSENLKARVSRELSRIEDLNKNTQSSKDNVTGQ